MKTWHWWIFALLIGMLSLATGCTNQPQSTNAESPVEFSEVDADAEPADAGSEQTAVAPTEDATPEALTTESSSVFPGLPRLQGSAVIELTVEGVDLPAEAENVIRIEVDGNNAPITAGNFVDLVQRGFYDQISFHRVVRDPQPFVVQGGDPQSKDPSFPVELLGNGGFIDPNTGQERYIPLEIKPEAEAKPVYSNTLALPIAPELKHYRGAVAMARSNYPDSASSQFYIALSDLQALDGNYAVFGYVTAGMELVDAIQQGDRIVIAKVVSGLENLQVGN